MTEKERGLRILTTKNTSLLRPAGYGRSRRHESGGREAEGCFCRDAPAGPSRFFNRELTRMDTNWRAGKSFRPPASPIMRHASCSLVSPFGFLTTDCTDYTDFIGLEQGGAACRRRSSLRGFSFVEAGGSWRRSCLFFTSKINNQQSSIVHPLVAARWVSRLDLRVTIFDI